MDTKSQREARACLKAMAGLIIDSPEFALTGASSAGLVPLRVLLGHAEELVDGKDDAREKKNAGDRKRRARKKPASSSPRRKKVSKPAPIVVPRLPGVN